MQKRTSDLAFMLAALAFPICMAVGSGAIAGTAPVGRGEAGQAGPKPAPAEKAERDALILDRQLTMQQLEKDSDAFGDTLAGIKPTTELPRYARALAAGAKEAKRSFDVKAEGGRTKPEVWANWSDFSARMDHFVTATDALAKAASADPADPAAVAQLSVEALTCKQCHDTYRTAKKPGE